jgi:hypothetical protein
LDAFKDLVKEVWKPWMKNLFSINYSWVFFPFYIRLQHERDFSLKKPIQLEKTTYKIFYTVHVVENDVLSIKYWSS